MRVLYYDSFKEQLWLSEITDIIFRDNINELDDFDYDFDFGYLQFLDCYHECRYMAFPISKSEAEVLLVSLMEKGYLDLRVCKFVVEEDYFIPYLHMYNKIM